MAVRYFGCLWQIKSPSLEISPINGMIFKLGSAGVCLDTAKCTVAHKASLLRQKVQENKACEPQCQGRDAFDRQSGLRPP